MFYRISFLWLCWISVAWSQGILRGYVFDALTNEPLSFAAVQLQGTSKGAYSDSTGAFIIQDIPPGLYNISVSLIGYTPRLITEITITIGKEQTIEVRLDQDNNESETVEITANPFTKTEESPISLRSISSNEIERYPGGNRDISKVIQSLPGVVSPPSFRNDIIIRGGSPNENRFFLDGIEIPNINHFATQGASGGPQGMLNVNLINEVNVFSGAFPSSRGNALSSVFEFSLKDGRSDRIGALGVLSATDVGITLEGPISPTTTFLFSARRSYLQFLFKAIGLPFLPTYNDFQFKVKTMLSKKDELLVLGLGAIDHNILNLEADSTEQQRYILAYLPSNSQWNYAIGARYRHFSANGFWTLVLSRNMLDNRSRKFESNNETLPLILDYLSQESENKFRVEYTGIAGPWKYTAGAGVEYVRYVNDTYNRISTPDGPIAVNFNSLLTFAKVSAFANVSRSLFSGHFTVSGGLRTDIATYSMQMSNPLNQLSPRISASWNLSPRFSLNANAGIYHQLPAYTVMGYRDSTGNLTNRENGVRYIRCNHLVAGIEYRTEKNSRFTMEGFWKEYDRYPYSLQEGVSLGNLGGDFGVVGNEPVTSTSRGRAYGIEWLSQQKLYKGFYGIAAFTLYWSTFTDANGVYRPSAWDNRFLVSLTAGKKFGKNWELGGRWRFGGGAPFTPVDVQRSSLISVFNVSGRGLPDYTRVNSERTPAYHFLDLRIDKKWFFNTWSLDAYFDIQNAYNFQAQSAPIMVADRDANGNPIVSPVDPLRYQVRLIENTNGTLLPSVGIIVEW